MYGTELIKKVIKNIVINAFVVNGNDKEVCVPPPFHFACFVFCVVLTNIDEHGDRMWTCLSTPSLWLIGLFSIWRKPPNDNEDFKARTRTIAFKYTFTSVFISSRHDLPRNVLHCILVGTFRKFLLICRQLLFFFLFINFFYRNAVFYHFSNINVIVHKPPSSWPRVSDPHHFSQAVRIGNSSLTKMIILCLSYVCVWGNYLDYWNSYHTWWCIKCAFAEI